MMTSSKRPGSPQQHSAGFTILEVLVAMLILAIGLLGQMGLQMSSLNSSQTGYFRSQAAFLATDIADRMRLNEIGVDSGLYDNFTTEESYSSPDCFTNGCSTAEIAEQDKFDWKQQLETLMPSAEGSVERHAGIASQAVFTISIRWQGNIDARTDVDNSEAINTLTLDIGL